MGAMKVGAGGEEDAFRGREEGGEEVGGWGFGVAAPPRTGGFTPWGAGGGGGGERGAAALALDGGLVLVGDPAAGTEGLLAAAAAAGGSVSGGVEDLGALPSEEDGTALSSTGLF